ncbi:unnamed protein product [Pieris macdunnoughi]|uniref:Uncharacterized protein n=1 Tax=Pieris macdunnoughi TaxID=345717 RepID=A0A821NZP2_9NEOP|nr:unnamed protein product [Pieris macdunnoughi]
MEICFPIININGRWGNNLTSDDYDSEGSEEYSDEEVYSQGAHEEEIKRLKAMVCNGRKGANIPGTRDTSAQSSTLPDSDIGFSASRPAPRQLEFDRRGYYEFIYEIDGRSWPSIVQDYGDLLPDIPENLFNNISTPSVSLLRSNAITPICRQSIMTPLRLYPF